MEAALEEIAVVPSRYDAECLDTDTARSPGDVTSQVTLSPFARSIALQTYLCVIGHMTLARDHVGSHMTQQFQHTQCYIKFALNAMYKTQP